MLFLQNCSSPLGPPVPPSVAFPGLSPPDGPALSLAAAGPLPFLCAFGFCFSAAASLHRGSITACVPSSHRRLPSCTPHLPWLAALDLLLPRAAAAPACSNGCTCLQARVPPTGPSHLRARLNTGTGCLAQLHISPPSAGCSRRTPPACRAEAAFTWPLPTRRGRCSRVSGCTAPGAHTHTHAHMHTEQPSLELRLPSDANRCPQTCPSRLVSSHGPLRLALQPHSLAARRPPQAVRLSASEIGGGDPEILP